jgi:hypothetical protein
LTSERTVDVRDTKTPSAIGRWISRRGALPPPAPANIAGSPCVVLARNKTRSTIIVFGDRTVAVAESAVRRWRIYPLGPASTPLSLLGGDDGLPTTREQYPLLPVPEQIQEMATRAGVNTVLFAAALR